MSPFEAVTVAPDDERADGVVHLVVDVRDARREPDETGRDGDADDLRWIDDVSSAFTVTDVPAWIVPPVTKASTVTVVVFVPTAAATAPATD